MATRTPRPRIMPDPADTPTPEDAQPQATGIGETHGDTPNTQEREEAPRERTPARTIKMIAGELDQEAGAVAGLELQIRNHRNRIIELNNELTEALAPALRSVGIQNRTTHAGTGLAISTPESTRKPRTPSKHSGRTDGKTVRAWLQEQGWINPKTQKVISNMGAVPDEGYDHYDAAH